MIAAVGQASGLPEASRLPGAGQASRLPEAFRLPGVGQASRLPASALLFIVGFLAIVSQIILLRELSVAFYGVELVYAIALAAWMAANAAGALLPLSDGVDGGRDPGQTVPSALPLPRARENTGRVSWLVAAAALACPVAVAWIRGSRLLLGATPGAYLPFSSQLFVLTLALAPVAVLLGFAFRLAAHQAGGSPARTAAAYALESAGAVVGGLVATAAFALGVQNLTLTLVAATGAPTALAALRAIQATKDRAPLARYVWSALALLLAGITVLGAAESRRLDLAMTRWSHPAAIDSRDSPYARVTTTRSASQSALFLDDVLVYESETADSELLAHVAALFHPRPARMLLLGGSAARVDVELLKHRPTLLDLVEIDPTLVALSDRPTRDGEGVRRLVFADPRAFLASAGTYDLVVVSMPDPVSGLTNRFYTREFFQACADRLAPGGVVAFSLQLAENVVSPSLAHRTASVLAALRAVYPHVRLFAGERAVFIASSAELPDEPAPLVARLAERSISTRLVTVPFLQYLFADDRRKELATRLDRTPAPVNSDAFPASYRYASVMWLSKFFPSMIGVQLPDVRLTARGGLMVVALLALASVLARIGVRHRPAARAVVLAASAGAGGMILETVVLLAYQSKTGAVFEHIGLLLSAFMLGLSAGAWVLRGNHPSRPRTLALLALMAALAATSAVAAVAGAPLPLLSGLLLLGLVGADVGGLFSSALATWPAGEVGVVYAADLVGGCAGGIAAAVALAPFAGLTAAALLVAVVAVGAAITCW